MKNGKEIDMATLAKEWLYYEQHGIRLRLAHRFAEWDGWEEDLIDCMLGPEVMEEEWFRDWDDAPGPSGGPGDVSPPFGTADSRGLVGLTSAVNEILVSAVPVTRRAPVVQPATTNLLPFVKEKDKEKMLNTTGDICGGRGGELGRRLEAWLTVGGNEPLKKWSAGDADVEADHE